MSIDREKLQFVLVRTVTYSVIYFVFYWLVVNVFLMAFFGMNINGSLGTNYYPFAVKECISTFSGSLICIFNFLGFIKSFSVYLTGLLIVLVFKGKKQKTLIKEVIVATFLSSVDVVMVFISTLFIYVLTIKQR